MSFRLFHLELPFGLLGFTVWSCFLALCALWLMLFKLCCLELPFSFVFVWFCGICHLGFSI